jgi:Flp pilus assembly pilin Flp
MTRRRREDGAAAVEFALVVPMLLIILLAIISLGWVFNQQLTLTQAAREGARIIAVQPEDAGSVAAAEARITGMVGPGATITYPTTCSEAVEDDEITVRVEAPMEDITGWLAVVSPAATLAGVGSMRCGG